LQRSLASNPAHSRHTYGTADPGYGQLQPRGHRGDRSASSKMARRVGSASARP